MLEGHRGRVRSLAFGPEGARALSGASDGTVRLWDLESGCCLRLMDAHADQVLAVAFGPMGGWAVSGLADNSAQLWDLQSGRCLRVLEGQSSRVSTLALGLEVGRMLSGTNDGVLRLWNLTAATSSAFSNPANAVTPPRPYREKAQSAKVVLLGDSGAGKTGLAMRLAMNDWEPTRPTVGAHSTRWKPPVSSGGDKPDIWFWDFGGSLISGFFTRAVWKTRRSRYWYLMVKRKMRWNVSTNGTGM